MYKKIFIILTTIFLLSLNRHTAYAFEKNTFITVANPVTGLEGWTGGEQSPLDMPHYQYQEATKSALPVTWLLRFDIVNNATFSANFKQLIATDSSQTLGAYLEVTPKLAEHANVNYPDGDYISQPHRVFLSGYTQENRRKLIDTYMDNFFKNFGFYPKSIGAWYIDSYSLNYLAQKYSVLAAVLCDEQYTTDSYRLWGAYLGSPYFPNKTNPLIPANNFSNRINLAVTKWAIRDPYNFYGTGGASSFSVQINDYLFQRQDTSYFDRLLAIYSDRSFNEFSQIVIGLENSYPLELYRQEISRVYRLLKERQGKYNLKFIQLDQFGDWLKARYPESSPSYVYKTTDPTGNTNGEILWYQNPFYRLGIKKQDNKTYIIDFRLYHQNEAEAYYLTPNTQKFLYAETPSIIDSVKYKNSEILLDFDLNINNLQFTKNSWIINATDSGKILTLEPKKIIFKNFVAPSFINEEIKIKKDNNQTVWILDPHTPFNDFEERQFSYLIKLFIISIPLIWLIRKKFKNNLQIIIISLFIIPITLITVFKSGLIFPYGLGIWGPNGHDAIFHLSIINSFRQSLLNFDNPLFSGFKLQNYHLGFNYLTAIFGRLLNVSSIDAYFRFLPLMITIFITTLTILLTSLWKFTKTSQIYALILVFLAGSLGFIPRFISGQGIFSGESVFWVNQSISILLNPPFALSLVFLILFLYLIEKKDINKSSFYLILLGLVGGVLVQIKIYAFILLCLSLLLNRQIKVLITIGLFGLIFILPSLGESSFPFIFRPFWFPETMIAAHDRLNLRTLSEAWQAYQNNGQFLKLALINLLALIIFIVGNLGIRLIGLYHILTRNFTYLSERITTTIILLGIIIPLLFIQDKNPWNTIQFLYYSLFFLGIFTAQKINFWFKKIPRLLLIPLIIIILIITFSTTAGTIKEYLTTLSATRISFIELRALNTLKSEQSGIVISPPFRPFPGIKIYDPRPLYTYTSTAYISAFSNQPEYLSDTINLNITNYDYQEREKLARRFYNTKNEDWAKEFLIKNKIKFIYENPITPLQFNPESIGAIKIFDSGEINIYKLNHND